ncbi:hypothetical protein PR048_013530 [Dryococelus australis]|uniref:Uncharacterized protein n=1 Tax=Dryococelus australis TaxID=614101 RepID=A0ABQ9HSR3_9NEOP|nr:hypothetical protein PR048_013530 [Dryococelus australis]
MIGHKLPSDASTLLCTPRKTNARAINPGMYWHSGLENSVKNVLNDCVMIDSSIELVINVDGVPLSRSSGSTLWPILALVYPYKDVFLIGAYRGYEKPASSSNFIEDFVQEFNHLHQSGVIIGETFAKGYEKLKRAEFRSDLSSYQEEDKKSERIGLQKKLYRSSDDDTQAGEILPQFPKFRAAGNTDKSVKQAEPSKAKKADYFQKFISSGSQSSQSLLSTNSLKEKERDQSHTILEVNNQSVIVLRESHMHNSFAEDSFRPSTQELKTIGDKDLKNVVYRIMPNMLTNVVTIQYSWISGKGKLMFSTLNLTNAIFASMNVRSATAERLKHSPHTKAIRVRFPSWSIGLFHVGIVPGRCCWSAVFSHFSRFPHSSFQALPHIHFMSPLIGFQGFASSPNLFTHSMKDYISTTSMDVESTFFQWGSVLPGALEHFLTYGKGAFAAISSTSIPMVHGSVIQQRVHSFAVPMILFPDVLCQEVDPKIFYIGRSRECSISANTSSARCCECYNELGLMPYGLKPNRTWERQIPMDLQYLNVMLKAVDDTVVQRRSRNASHPPGGDYLATGQRQASFRTFTRAISSPPLVLSIISKWFPAKLRKPLGRPLHHLRAQQELVPSSGIDGGKFGTVVRVLKVHLADSGADHVDGIVTGDVLGRGFSHPMSFGDLQRFRVE